MKKSDKKVLLKKNEMVKIKGGKKTLKKFGKSN